MRKRKPLTLQDFEEEARKLMQPATEKERAIVTAAMDLIAKKGVGGAQSAVRRDAPARACEQR